MKDKPTNNPPPVEGVPQQNQGVTVSANNVQIVHLDTEATLAALATIQANGHSVIPATYNSESHTFTTFPQNPQNGPSQQWMIVDYSEYW